MDNNMPKKEITIYDIAREAGVSAATVSRVLTNKANVRPEKKEKVEELIRKYNFRPNALARSLSDTKSKVIGIIAADVRNPFYASIFVACETAANERGYTVLLCNSLGQKSNEIKQLEMLKQHRVDVIIQFGGRADDLTSDKEYVKKVNEITKTIPMVVTGKLDNTPCFMVQVDAMKAADLLLKYLIGMGHRNIALIGGRQDVVSTHLKYEQYVKVMNENGIDINPAFIAEGDYNDIVGYRKMEEMIKSGTIPSAVIAINDLTAAGIIRCLKDNNLRIPEDISVVSYDNVFIADLMQPSLTTIDYNYEEFGIRLVETAIAAVNGENVPLLQKITPRLIERESAGKCNR